ncbi:hypothetical protein [Streptomyces yunnanensis]|uniref:Uncharacterized protein n=1 Tax=Streptomyces yunnanensis TaxID=156453 RepID=A0A9X8N5N1_9ACTN|nr:hypothetical protein [Streptomyces yunnanensis]SHN08604.1 hypothetical protein SAMN05216268_11992 [Streptomyces yunnanensis]
MSIISKTAALRGLAVVAAVATLGITAPQAWAIDGPGAVAGVAISPKASKETRAVAAAEVKAAQYAANLCGSDYALWMAQRLPEASNRKGTLFLYSNSDNTGACAIFDNNTASAKYMKLQLCENQVNPRCSVDEGTFSEYAGPVRITGDYVFCSKVTALMKNSAGSGSYLINRVAYATPCD